jgi:hypothetical protein
MHYQRVYWLSFKRTASSTQTSSISNPGGNQDSILGRVNCNDCLICQLNQNFSSALLSQIISFNVFNLGDRLYRNHLSFIKDFAPELGRGVRVTYTLRFF